MNCGLKIKCAEFVGKYWICLVGTGLISANIGGITMSKKHPPCPKCNGKNIAEFLFGLPRFDEELEKEIKENKIVLGGCSTAWDDPKWRCNDCGHRWNDDKKMKIFMSEIGHTCPECNGTNIALILWGYPGNMDAIKEELEKGKIVLGGCLVTDHDPKWGCNVCNHRWGKRDDD